MTSPSLMFVKQVMSIGQGLLRLMRNNAYVTVVASWLGISFVEKSEEYINAQMDGLLNILNTRESWYKWLAQQRD